MKLKLNRAELRENMYNGYDLLFRMVTAETDNGEYIKHIKITEEVLKIFNQSTVEVPEWVDTDKLLRKDRGKGYANTKR